MSITPFNNSVGQEIARREATKEREAFGSFACPICGGEDVHAHEEWAIARWVEAQIGRFNLPGWVLVKGGQKPSISPCPHCGQPPRAVGDRDCGLWSYTVRCINDDCMGRLHSWADTSEAAKTKWEEIVRAAHGPESASEERKNG